MLKTLPVELEEYRDRRWRRAPEGRVETVVDGEAFVEEVGFCGALTDARTNLPSLYIAVCGRRDAFMPRNVQKDPEASFAWRTKDELMRRGRVYYAKLLKGRSTFIAPRLVAHFNTIYGMPRKTEKENLSPDALAILKVLRQEWEMATKDLRAESGVKERARFNKAMDELQRAMKVIPSEVLYEPSFTYIWMLAEGRFAKELSTKVKREVAVREIARAYLQAAGQTGRGELARATGLTRAEAGKANHQLVAEGFAIRLEVGVYRLAGLAVQQW
ncbi:MAG: hypothetical protein HY231_16245 [Acidobacteria bacterium]|nr:hypothetical protein [Acidobacteriota bacterium]